MGTRPIGPAEDDFVDYPSATTILGAAKITGRLQSKTSVGFLAAATAEESADLADAELGAERSVRVAPRAYYGVGRVLQEFGAERLDGRPLRQPGAPRLRRTAIRWPTSTRERGGACRQYAAALQGWRSTSSAPRRGGSLVTGTEAAMTRVQRSSAHFAQRPDRDYAPLDPTLTSLPGWTAQADFDRTGGRHWLWGVSTKADSVNFETNDFAILNGADGLLISGNLTLPRDAARTDLPRVLPSCSTRRTTRRSGCSGRTARSAGRSTSPGRTSGPPTCR